MPRLSTGPPGEADTGLQALFVDLFSQEGYAVLVAASLQEAFQRADESSFALVLVDLFLGGSTHPLTAARHLGQRVAPTPLGLLMTRPLSPEEAKRLGFAYIVSLPFETLTLLLEMAACINPPLTPAQQQQGDLVEQFFVAMDMGEWDTLARLCAEDLRVSCELISLCMGRKNSTGFPAFAPSLSRRSSTSSTHGWRTFASLGVPKVWRCATGSGGRPQWRTESSRRGRPSFISVLSG